MKKLHEYLKKLCIPKFVAVAIIPQLILYFIVYYTIDGCIRKAPYEVMYSNKLLNSSLYGAYWSIIEAPFRETLIFQVIIIHIILLYSDSKKNQITAAALSSIIFGGVHFLQTTDFIWACFWGIRTGIFGLILNYAYIMNYYKFKNKFKGIATGILVVFLIHSGNNLLSAIFLKIINII
ncbi:CPBP family intramembrane metalloprotease [Clostridium sp. P21]|uniref:CPBP family intramembrane metalloprotease n=1 Tax=Clostridium muellerianum TaxID=2716538 RepID=A0A7Y0EI65_9CLOT|nr:CPBP family glutamic-type intramembrane protease [Clostridium muellerianum]NMM63920.1 CPBP family intramembrane metalloprotease [Clostridium muellerianum]